MDHEKQKSGHAGCFCGALGRKQRHHDLDRQGHEGGSGSRGRTLYPEEIYDLETGGRL